MADLAVLTAVSGAGWESQLVTALESAPGGLYVARRCVDVADLLATAAAGHGRVVLLSADLRRLDRDVLSRLGETGLAVVGVVSPGAGTAVDRLRHLGVTDVVAADVDPGLLAEIVATAVERAEAGGVGQLPAEPAQGPADLPPGNGRVVAVWGPCGAPGRTTIAINLAAELARAGLSTMVVDADTYGASVAQVLGVLDEAPGLAGACRAANAGQLDAPALATHAREIVPGMRVLTGITRAGRWPELRASSLEVVWRLARHTTDVTVVDAGFCLERDDDLSFDTAAPQRNAATLSAIEEADVVLAVGSADPVGLARLVRGLSELAEAVPGAPVHVVVNRVRRSVGAADPEREISSALNRYAGVTPLACVPDDPQALDAALVGGMTLVEGAPGSSARQAMGVLAAEVAAVGDIGGGLVTPKPRSRGWRPRRR